MAGKRMMYKKGGSYGMKKKTSMKGPRKGQTMKNGGRKMRTMKK